MIRLTPAVKMRRPRVESQSRGQMSRPSMKVMTVRPLARHRNSEANSIVLKPLHFVVGRTL